MHNSFFVKYHHLGNDFIIIDDRKKNFSIVSDKIYKLCHRTLGIGADGVILLQNKDDHLLSFRMRIFNSDGKEAESCGNGLLCLMKFLNDYKIISSKSLNDKKVNINIFTMNDMVIGTYFKRYVSIQMDTPQRRKINIDLNIDGKNITIHFAEAGVPHAVLFVDRMMDKNERLNIAKKIRHHPYFAPKGVNVNFVCRKGKKDLVVRTFERGVEAETLACGTGAIASAIISDIFLSDADRGENVFSINFEHGAVKVCVKNNTVCLSGMPKKVFSGFFLDNKNIECIKQK